MQKNLGYDLEEGHVATASAQGPATTEQIGHSNAPLSTSSDCRTGDLLFILSPNQA